MFKNRTNIKTGLSSLDVEERVLNNQVNYDTTVPTKSTTGIINSHIFTLFNLLNFVLALSIIIVDSYKNLMFMGVVIINTLIGIIQELNSKRIVDELSLLNMNKVLVIRDGKEIFINQNEIVIDDITLLSNGDQVVCDAIIVEGSCEVNESFITGEGRPLYKKEGELLLSGSFIVSGEVTTQVKNVGKDNYSAKITSEIKVMKNKKSELMYSLNRIIKSISIVILPLGVLLFFKQLSIDGNNFNMAVINTVAALIGMIPEGLILLTSTVLAISIIRLARKKVLVQQLYSIESLARIDTICLDKTGTLTDGLIEFVDFIPIADVHNVDEIISELGHNLSENQTILSLRKRFSKKNNWSVVDKVPFSSHRKWSGVNFEKHGSYIIGAPEIILGSGYNEIKKEVDNCAKEYRVILLAKSNYEFRDNELPKNINPLGLILLRNQIREGAIENIKYFKEQGVDIKIVSGDNVLTVSSVANRVGLDKSSNYIDMSLVEDESEIRRAAMNYSIFGRTSPYHKKIIVNELMNNGHVVGFVGDGVNDALALKEADCGIAMASGSSAARNVSELVLLDSDFSAMPHIVSEGRRTINNIERSSTLFLVKTIYATVLAILFLFINRPYPFEPIQLSLTSVFTIGIPSFILAIEPNKAKINGKFLTNVISKALPTALTNIISILLIMLISSVLKLSISEVSTISVILIAFTGFMLLFKLCLPFNFIRLALMVFTISGFLIGVLGLPNLFSLSMITPLLWVIIILLIIISIFNFNYLTSIYYKLRKKHPRIFS